MTEPVDHRGVGDRWLAGEPVPGVAFEQHTSVGIVGGRHHGDEGIVILLMALGDDPLYLVRLRSTIGEIRVRQSSLRHSE